MEIKGIEYESLGVGVIFTYRPKENGFRTSVVVQPGNEGYRHDREKDLPLGFKLMEDGSLVASQDLNGVETSVKVSSIPEAVIRISELIANGEISGAAQPIEADIYVLGHLIYRAPMEYAMIKGEEIEILFKDGRKPLMMETGDGNDGDDYLVYCPICNHFFEGSSYLKTVFDDEKALWFANMVMHYRHTHITSWNKCWGYGGRYYRSGWFGNYDDEKAKVNERAKRQILRKCKEFLKEKEFTPEVLDALQNTTDETREVARKILG